MRKRIGALLLGLALFVSGSSWEVLAADGGNGPGGQADQPEAVEQVWVNPIYQDVEDPGSLRAVPETGEEVSAPEGRAEAGGTVTFLSMKGAVASLCSQLVARSSLITVYVDAGNMDIRSVSSALFQEAVAVGKGTAGDEGDYIMYHTGGYQSSTVRVSYYDPSKYRVMYAVSYYTTQQQEKQVTTKVKSVLSSLGVSRMSTYGKIKTIHDYICKNIRYDYDTLYDSSKGKYTAYNALLKKKAVCQGYASLFYRMAVDSGLRVRVIPGSSRGVPHAWNIVKLGSSYYNLDSTWDAGVRTPQYFLKSNRDFPDHTRDQECLTSAFQKAHPMTSTSYKKSAAAGVYAMSKVTVSGIRAKAYTGKKLTQNATLKSGGVTLKKDRDYTVSYKSNVNIGTATVTFKGKGKYSGTLKKTYKIVVKKGAVYKVGAYRYKIVNANTNGRGTVRPVGASRNIKQVKIGGKRFKVLK